MDAAGAAGRWAAARGGFPEAIRARVCRGSQREQERQGGEQQGGKVEAARHREILHENAQDTRTDTDLPQTISRSPASVPVRARPCVRADPRGAGSAHQTKMAGLWPPRIKKETVWSSE